MIYNLKSIGNQTSIELKGRLTFSDYATFREMLQIFSENPVKKCFFNLSELEFIDSAGLGMLLIARDKIQTTKGHLILKGAQGQVKKMLDLGRFDSLFILEDEASTNG
ncbi:MAG: STAS domain-containing protein [Proteobacteria bacterium]|nr:STAS domain-containing protein [Pseudomonadota bacterium]